MGELLLLFLIPFALAALLLISGYANLLAPLALTFAGVSLMVFTYEEDLSNGMLWVGFAMSAIGFVWIVFGSRGEKGGAE